MTKELNASTPDLRNPSYKTSLSPDLRPQDAEAHSAILRWKHIGVKEREKGEHDADHSRREELRCGSCRKPLRGGVTDQHQDQEHHGHAWKNEFTHVNILSHLALARHCPDEDKHKCEHGDKGKNLECQSEICHDVNILSLSSDIG